MPGVRYIVECTLIDTTEKSIGKTRRDALLELLFLLTDSMITLLQTEIPVPELFKIFLTFDFVCRNIHPSFMKGMKEESLNRKRVDILHQILNLP